MTNWSKVNFEELAECDVALHHASTRERPVLVISGHIPRWLDPDQLQPQWVQDKCWGILMRKCQQAGHWKEPV